MSTKISFLEKHHTKITIKNKKKTNRDFQRSLSHICQVHLSPVSHILLLEGETV